MKKFTTITTAIAFVVAGLALYLKKMRLFKKDKS
jgi:hypothetical protein